MCRLYANIRPLGSHGGGVCADRTQNLQIPKGPVQVLLHDSGGFTASWVLPYSLEKLLHVLEEGGVATLVLCFPKTLGVLGFSWASWGKKKWA